MDDQHENYYLQRIGEITVAYEKRVCDLTVHTEQLRKVIETQQAQLTEYEAKEAERLAFDESMKAEVEPKES